MRVVLPALVSALIAFLAMPAILRLALKRGWYDKPDHRKIHVAPTPRLGGVAIFWAAALTLAGLAVLRPELGLGRYWAVYVVGTVIYLVGLLDDFFSVRARYRFIVQLLGASVLVALDYQFSSVYLPFTGTVNLGWAGPAISVVWIVGIINALNMIDGMDGLAGGISLIALVAYTALYLELGQVALAHIAVVLIGSVTVFLFFNLPPAKTFMGDAGSNFLGFILAMLPLMGTRSMSGVYGLRFVFAITVVLVPLLDVFAAIWRRMREGRHIMDPDKWHLHHKLLHMGFGTRAILAIVYAQCIFLAIVALMVLFFRPRVYLLLIIFAWAIVAGFFIVLHFRKERSLDPKGCPEP